LGEGPEGLCPVFVYQRTTLHRQIRLEEQRNMRVFKIRAESKCAFTFSMRQIAQKADFQSDWLADSEF